MGATKAQTFRVTIYNKSAGFTLIEIVIVMAMIALFATMAAPRIQNRMDLDLKKRARMLSSASLFLYNQAAFKNSTYRLHYDLDQHKYWVEVAQGMVRLEKQMEERRFSKRDTEKQKSKFAADTSIIKKPIQLEKGLKFKDIKTEASPDPFTSGHVYTHFFPSGYAEQTRIRLKSEQGKVYTIEVNPLTGSAKIYDHDVEEGRF